MPDSIEVSVELEEAIRRVLDSDETLLYVSSESDLPVGQCPLCKARYQGLTPMYRVYYYFMIHSLDGESVKVRRDYWMCADREACEFREAVQGQATD